MDIAGKPDINRQSVILKSLSIYPHKHLSLSHCTILDDDALKLVLNKSTQLQTLDLRDCPKITYNAIKYLAIHHTSLEKLYLSNNPGITAIEDGFIIKGPLYWPSLERLHISRCINLVSLNINAPKLIELKDTSCTKLRNKQLIAPFLKEPTLQTLDESQPIKPLIDTLPVITGQEDIINIIIWVENQAEKYYSYDTNRYQYQTKTVHTYLFPDSQTIDSKSFGGIDIVLLVYDGKSKSSITKTEQITQHICKKASHPLPILIISVSRDCPKPDIVYAEYYEPSAGESAGRVIEDVVKGAPTAALLFHEAMTHQLQTGALQGAKLIQLPKSLHLTRSGFPGLKIVAVSFSNEKADHTHRYFTGYYKLMHSIIGVEFYSKKIRINDQDFQIQLWDTAAQERFQSFLTVYYRGAALALIFAPLDDYDEFIKTAKFYVSHAKNFSLEIALIGMKEDKRVITQDEAFAIAKDNGINLYSECSAITGKGINEAFQKSFEFIINHSKFWEWLGRPYNSTSAIANATKFTVSDKPHSLFYNQQGEQSTVRSYTQKQKAAEQEQKEPVKFESLLSKGPKNR